MTCSSMDDKRRVYDSIRFPPFFLGSPGACACNVYQALSPPEGPGYEATTMYDPILRKKFDSWNFFESNYPKVGKHNYFR